MEIVYLIAGDLQVQLKYLSFYFDYIMYINTPI